MKQTRMKSFVEQSERHYVSVPRHHLWSRIYIILRVLVFHICRVYVSVCISMCLHVCVRLYMCVSPCTTILSPFLAFSLSLSHIFSYFFHSRILSLASFRSFLSHPSFSPALSRSFHCMYTRAHVLSARFFSPSLSDIPRALSSPPRCTDNLSIPYFYGTELDSEQGNYAGSNENHNCFSFDHAS